MEYQHPARLYCYRLSSRDSWYGSSGCWALCDGDSGAARALRPRGLDRRQVSSVGASQVWCLRLVHSMAAQTHRHSSDGVTTTTQMKRGPETRHSSSKLSAARAHAPHESGPVQQGSARKHTRGKRTAANPGPVFGGTLCVRGRRLAARKAPRAALAPPARMQVRARLAVVLLVARITVLRVVVPRARATAPLGRAAGLVQSRKTAAAAGAPSTVLLARTRCTRVVVPARDLVPRHRRCRHQRKRPQHQPRCMSHHCAPLATIAHHCSLCAVVVCFRCVFSSIMVMGCIW